MCVAVVVVARRGHERGHVELLRERHKLGDLLVVTSRVFEALLAKRQDSAQVRVKGAGWLVGLVGWVVVWVVVLSPCYIKDYIRTCDSALSW